MTDKLQNDPPTAPDLMGGFMLNGKGGGNLWSTEIQSALRETSDAGSHNAYLSHECRMENLPFSSGYLGGGETIFQRNKPWEFLLYVAGGKTRQLCVVDVELVPDHDIARQPVPDMLLPINIDLTGNVDSEPFCADRRIEYMPHETALSALRKNRLRIREVFLHVSWSAENAKFDLFCPCRYINFPPLEQTNDFYIQPISGYVLYPLCPDRYLPAYVACAVNADGKQIIEFCCKRYRSIHGWIKNYGGEMADKNEGLASLPVFVSQFDGMIKVDGVFKIYTYL
ncbi:MAG: hypothetical protein A3G18_12145 [Rhodospirillales bacterium RIFCSPLOWO2_12_FULL_58_28]|nr:MAG: hypothetical protein A3H92_12160 [Rhodospirillales bacterium RIFCSPLOWO2_02_FULL_58_16]OHC79616.1 MAG: hypothetical protein A3G18_12145 [Rhodospirillales bacterium RIFCSPLOWO2_12_FULL_58_28]